MTPSALALSIALSWLAAATAVAHAETPTPARPLPTPVAATMTVVVDAGALDRVLPAYQAAWRGEVRTRADEMISIDAYVGAEKCSGVNVTATGGRDPSGNRLIQVGASNQPSACRQEGATITFVDGHGRTLAGTLPFRPGTTPLLPTLAPRPPHTGFDPLDGPSTESVPGNASATDGRDVRPLLAAGLGLIVLGIVARRLIHRNEG